MKERPILFSGAMVRAILAGNKTQTRRALKIQPLDVLPMNGDLTGKEWIGLKQKDPPKGLMFKCKYGEPGDRLWVRETHYLFGQWGKNGVSKSGKQKWKFVTYREQGAKYQEEPPASVCKLKEHIGWFKRPSIHMPRWASRINLEIIGIRVERLQDISEEDARAEGASRTLWYFPNPKDEDSGINLHPYGLQISYRSGFATLWDSINTERGFGWNVNPWVWVVEFRRVP